MSRLYLLLIVLCIVRALDPPGNITLTDPDGQPIKDIKLTKFIFSGQYHFNCEVEQGSWTFEPELPQGMGFSKGKGILSGDPQVAMPLTQYKLTVSNKAGSSVLSFGMSVEECKYGFYLIRKVKGSVHLTFKHNGLIKEDKDVSINDQEHYHCLPRGLLSYTVTCLNTSSSDCIGQIITNSSMVYMYMRIPKGETRELTNRMEPLAPPTLTIDQSEFVIPADTVVESSFSVTEIHSAFLFEPALPEEWYFDNYLYVVRGRPKERGTYSFKITVNNTLGESSVYWNLFVDKCPEGKELLRLKSPDPLDGGYSILNDRQEEIAHDVFPTYRFSRNYCFDKGTYYFVMKSSQSLPWPVAVNSYDQADALLESFQKMNFLEEQKERFFLGNAIAVNDTLTYIVAQSMDERWILREFDDSNWVEECNPYWGSYSTAQDNAYFRKQLNIANPHKISQVLMNITVEDPFELYVNGKQLRIFTQRVTFTDEVTTQLVFPSTYLVEGVNQFAFVLHGNEVKDIVFSFQLHLTTSQCIQSTVSGDVQSDEEQPSTRYPPSAAFNYGFKWWETTQMPVTLFYQLNRDSFTMPSQMHISSKKVSFQARPTAFTVYGQVRNHTTDTVLIEDEIASVNATAFLQGVDTELVPLFPRRPYNAFRILFTQSSNMTTLRVHGLAFFTCQEDTCPKVSTIPAVRVGTVIPHKCPTNTYGVNQYICSRQDVEPHWIEDPRMCISMQPAQGIAYVDMSWKIENMRKAQLPAIQTAVEGWMPAYLVKKENITYPVITESIERESVLNITMRIQVDDEVGKVLQRVLKEEVGEFVKYMRTKLYREGCTSFRVISGPTLFEAPAGSSSSMKVLIIHCK